MTTKTFSETTERVQEAIKETSELFTNITTSLLDSYSKQINTGYEFYKKMSEIAQPEGKAKWEKMIKESIASGQKAINSTLNLSKKIMEETFSVFVEKEKSMLSKKSTDAILNIFTKQAEQSCDFGTQFLQAMKENKLLSPEEFEKQSIRFNELMRESIENSEIAIKEGIASYNEQGTSTKEENKKIMNIIEHQADSLAKIYISFTEELMHIIKGEKTTGSTEIKSQTKSKK